MGKFPYTLRIQESIPLKAIWKTLTLIVCLSLILAVFLPLREEASAMSQPAEPSTVPATTEVIPETIPELLGAAVPETEPPEITFDTVPQYFQTDYPYIKYGDGTIATSGCGLTSLAMVATYLTDHVYNPDQLIYHFADYGKNHVERLEYAAEQLKLPYSKNFNWQETLAALKEGKVAIVLENSNSLFTDQQHFIVLAGLTEDGRVIVNDPFRPNYYDEDLMDGFANGFYDYRITSGYSGAWVFDKSAIPEDLELYDASKPEMRETRYEGYELPQEDIDFLTRFVWAQAHNHSQQVQQAVLEVVLNRLVSNYFPNTVQNVVYGGMKKVTPNMQWAKPTMTQYRALTAAMYGPYILPEDVLFYTPWEVSGDVWGNIDDYWFSYTNPED